MNLRDVTAAAKARILDTAPGHGPTVRTRTWNTMHAPGSDEPANTLIVEATAVGDTEVRLCIDGPDDACLDHDQLGELIVDLHHRFIVIAGTEVPL